MIKIGDGNTAEVFLYNETKVLKLFKTGIVKAVALDEYARARLAAKYTFPKAGVHDLISVDGRFGIVYDLVKGVSLEAQTLATKDLGACAEQLAALHEMILSCVVEDGDCPDYKANLFTFVERLDISAEEKAAVKGKIAALPSGDRLCHGDFHPGNVILDGEKAVVIDFGNICRGPREYDIARTVYLIRDTPISEDCENPKEMRYLKDALAKLYLERSGVTEERIRPFLEIIAITRKAECPDE